MMIEATYLADFVTLLKNKVPFTFSRWGDGEWRCVLDKGRGSNCDGHNYFPEMCEELRQVLIRRPTYLLGMQNMADRMYGPQIRAWLQEHNLADLRWLNADVFHYGVIKGGIHSVISEMRRHPLVVVGPAHLRRANAILPYRAFIDVPPKNCYLSKDDIIQAIKHVMKDANTYTVVSISAGMPAEIIIDAVYHTCANHAVIDFGSVWDPWAGVYSRQYMKGKLQTKYGGR